MPEFLIKNIPAFLPGLCLPPLPVKLSSPLLEQGAHSLCPQLRSSVVLQELPDESQDPDTLAQDDFLLTSVTHSILGKRTPQYRRSQHNVQIVEEVTDFSVRRMTHSCAKRAGIKPTSAIPVRPTPLRRPKAKKLKLDADAGQDTPLPPPTPIATMQAIGASLSIASDKLSVEKLMAPPQQAPQDDGSHDE